MCMLTDRQYALLHLLRKTSDITVSSLSEELDVTSQTVKKDLLSLKNLLEKYHISVQISDSKLQITGAQNLERLIRENRLALDCSTDRKILLILLLEQTPVTLQDIADTLYLSRSKVDKELPGLLQKYPQELQSKRHYGLWYSGTWSQRFRRFVQILEPYIYGADYASALIHFSSTHFPLQQYITPQQIQIAKDILERVGHNSVFRLTDVSQRHLFLHLILLQRMHSNVGRESIPIPMIPEFSRLADQNDELWQIIDQIGQTFPIFASSFEKSYLYLHFALPPQNLSRAGYGPHPGGRTVDPAYS